ncbi:MAG: 4-hydroxybenzoate octaprenyltransferase [Gammaproteobacteria bacterium]|nr:4-hydroxybenzoate octaprenyltransferase [Gammaproteobacteria bacterium]
MTSPLRNSFFSRFQVTFLADRLHQYALLVRLHRPIGIYLLLWPTLWALWIAAEGVPDLLVLAVFVGGTVLMRSAGCAINDYADRNVDAHVKRTEQRPIVAGRVSPKEALWVFGVLSLLAFGLVLLLDWNTVLLSFGAVLLTAIYPFAKRYTHLPQVVLGAAFAWAIPMAFMAQTGELTQVTWLLYLATLLWTLAYDTFYAMADREEDLKIGVKSTAILFGEMDRVVVASLQLLTLLTLLLVGSQLELSWYYYLALVLGAGLFVYQQWMVRERVPQLCIHAFLNNHWFGLLIFIGLVAHYFFGVE